MTVLADMVKKLVRREVDSFKLCTESIQHGVRVDFTGFRRLIRRGVEIVIDVQFVQIVGQRRVELGFARAILEMRFGEILNDLASLVGVDHVAASFLRQLVTFIGVLRENVFAS